MEQITASATITLDQAATMNEDKMTKEITEQIISSLAEEAQKVVDEQYRIQTNQDEETGDIKFSSELILLSQEEFEEKIEQITEEMKAVGLSTKHITNICGIFIQ